MRQEVSSIWDPVAPLVTGSVFWCNRGAVRLQFAVGTPDQADGLFPGNAFICNGNPVFQVARTIAATLVAFKEIAFQHQAHDAAIAFQPLVQGAFENKGLTFELLA